MKSLFLEELLHDAVRQFFFVPLALFAQECYTLAIKDSVLSAGFSEIRKSAYANRTDRIFAHTGHCVPHGWAAGGFVRGPVDAACQPRQRHGARRRAEYAAQMAAERDAMLKRFRTASTVFGVGILLVLVYALGFRPIDTPPQTYKAPDLRQETGALQTAVSTDRKTRLELGEYQGVDCIRAKDGLLYAAAWNGAALKKRTSDLVRTDGGHSAAILSVESELTGFAFDAAGDVWLTQLTTAGGILCRAKHDSWGAAVEQVVTQLDGAPLGAVSAVEVSPAGKVYFAVAAAAGAENGLESALRTELLAHTATGCVYVYDPAARTVEKVLGGVAGAAGLALSPDGSTLYVSDLGSRCIWAVDAAARELTAGGRGCTAAFAGLPGYPGALAADTDGTLYISYRWARSGWLEKNADSTLLRGIALRAGQNTQERLFRCTADAPCAEAVSLATGAWEQTFTGLAQDSCAAVCPVESKVYFGAAGADSLLAANR